MAKPVGVEVVGLAEFRAELKALGAEWPRALTKVHSTIARNTGRLAQAFASSGTRQQAKSAGAIKGSGTQSGAKLSVSGGPAYAAAAFWGAKRHTGWYAKPQYAQVRASQFPKWVGNAWEVGGAGGPYALNDAIRQYMPELVRDYDRMIVDLAHRAFPE